MNDLERVVKIEAAYDKRHSDPSKNYGIHGVTMLFLVHKATVGAVQFMLYTNWHLPEVYGIEAEDLLDGTNYLDYGKAHSTGRLHANNYPIPADLGFHSPRPMYDGHSPIETECEWIGGEKCYYDGSSLNAWRPFEAMLRGGSDALWEFLEDYHRSTFKT